MKSNPVALRIARHQRGMALISVLAVLFLLTLLVVAFMARTTGARASAANYRATASTKALADTAVNLVQAQINEATTLGLTGGGAATFTWADQPGAIRVFDASGNLSKIYRLYSAAPAAASTARVATSLTDLAADLPPANSWNTAGAQWCDLNAYAADSAGRNHFPIMDPRDTGADPTADPSTVAKIWAPSSGALALKGFSVQPPANVVVASNPAPMPVRWLYILKDGSIVSPDAPSAATPNTLTFTSAVNAAGAADVPTAANPIVGRIAYWTDDEACKININTAAGDDVLRPATTSPPPVDPVHYYPSQSIFWAPPVFATREDANFAVFQPAAGEIQRYPGHPGTVGLNSTLSTLAGLTSPMVYNDFFSLTPRYGGAGAGNNLGSVSATNPAPLNGNQMNTVPLAASRLYTSVGEMIYKADRTASKLVTNTSEKQAAAAVERANFFLTAHSSSSELNLFGEPRISIWPWTTTYQTPADSLLAFDSTIRTTAGNELFYFQRTDATNATTDCNIAGNIQLFNYLDTLTSTSIPGFGDGSNGYAFSQRKYKNVTSTTSPTAMRQIIAEIFDYVRTINVLDPALVYQTGTDKVSRAYGQNWGSSIASVLSGGYSANNNGAPGGNNEGYRSGSGGVQVVPSSNNGRGINNWGYQGVGAFPIPVEFSVQFVALGTGQIPAKPPFAPNIVGQQPVPYQQYQFGRTLTVPTVAHDNLPAIYDSITDDVAPNPVPSGYPTNLVYTNPAGGRPQDSCTAIQAFVFTSFVNPALIDARIQPAFAYSMTGLNKLNVQGYTTTGGLSPARVYLHFPGNVSTTTLDPRTGSTPPGPFGDEEFLVNDNSDGAGFLNGYVGNWMFGYIPLYGETGNNNYGPGNPAILGPCQTTWNISQSNLNADGQNVSGGNRGGMRRFPFYSQIFSLPGIQKLSAAKGNINVNNKSLSVFRFNGSNIGPIPGVAVDNLITVTMYDAHADNANIGLSNKVAQYQFAFPFTNFDATTNCLPLPYLSAGTDSQLLGVMGNASQNDTTDWKLAAPTNRILTDRWTYLFNGSDQGYNFGNRRISVNDVVQSVTLSPTWSDVRDLAFYQASNPTSTSLLIYTPHPLYNQSTFGLAHNNFVARGEAFIGNTYAVNWGRLVSQYVNKTGSPSYYPSEGPVEPPTATAFVRLAYMNYPVVPPLLNGPNGNASVPPNTGQLAPGAYTDTGAPGDWDNGIANYPDGPWVNMADEGCLQSNLQTNNPNSIAYYSTGNTAQKSGVTSTFSPNRQVPSPGMLGSLPTGVSSTKAHPWQTLLFRPGAGHGGFGKFHWGERDQPNIGDPADHLLLDLFWMPQAEPYPISQPFVSEGKINLNYEIQPFTYITRNTALRALFAGEEIAVMPDALAATYKDWNNGYTSCAPASIAANTGGNNPNGLSRLPIDPDQTLGLNSDSSQDPHSVSSGTPTAQTSVSAAINNSWYDYGTNTTRFFKSGSEICEMFLVPQGYTWKDFTGFSGLNAHSWYKIPNGDFALVGDNTRERPYTDIYSRVTTKSNTYTVYYTVQSLKNAQPQTDAGQMKWDESLGSVVGEYRGSTTLERYLDPNQQMPDFLGSPGAQSLESFYKWRVVATRQFAP